MVFQRQNFTDGGYGFDFVPKTVFTIFYFILFFCENGHFRLSGVGSPNTIAKIVKQLGTPPPSAR